MDKTKISRMKLGGREIYKGLSNIKQSVGILQ